MANKTTIRGNNQIKDLSINNNQIANNAGIETSKLAEGQELLKRDGSVPLTGDLDAGGNKIENLAAPVGDNDAARKIDVDSAVSDINSDISTLEGRLDTAESDIDALQAEDIALDGRLDVVEAKNVEQDGRLDSLEAEDIALDGRLDVVEAKNVEQDGRLDSLEAEDIALDGRLDVVEAKNVEQDGRLDTAESDIVSLEGRMDTAETDIDALQAEDIALDGRLDVVEAKNVEQDGRLDTAESDIVSLEGRMDTAESDIDALQAEDIALDGRLDVVEAKNVEQDGRLDSLEAEDIALDGRLDVVEAKNVEQDGRLDVVEAKNVEQDGRLDTAESDIDALDVRITSLENYDKETVFVDSVNGVDAVGRGTLLKPFKTINYAYSQIPAVAGATDLEKVTKFVREKIVIELAPGTYVENVQIGFKRARMAIVGNGALIVGSVKCKVLKADFPVASLESFKAQNPAPFTGVSAQMCFELAGEAGGGLEGDATANILTVTGLTSLDFENGGANYNWDSQYGQFYSYFDNANLIGGFNMIHDNSVATARAPACVVEIESSKVGNGDSATRSYLGFVPFGAATTVPAYGGLTLKAHNSTIASVLGPTLTIGEIDGCRLYDIDRTMGGVVTNGSISGSSSTSYIGIVNTQFRAFSGAAGSSVYKIGSSSGNVSYKIDSVSHGTLTVGRTLDVAAGRTVTYTLLDRAAGVLVVPTGNISSSTVQAALEELQGDVNTINVDLATKASISALNQEISDRIAGDNTLQSNINAEQSARISADSALDARMTTAEGDIVALEGRMDTAESDIDALQAEDIALDGRLDVVEAKNVEQDGRLDTAEADIVALEGRMDTAESDIDTLESGLAQEILDRQAGVQEAKDYTDQKVADLVNGAPAVLDTLKELADALGNDENFATTIAGQIGDLDTRLDAAELDIDTLQTDLAAEEAARIAADDVIDGRLDDLESGVFVSREIPSGLIDGSNTVFTLANTPNSNSEQIFLNGILQNKGSLSDYTISGDTITFAEAPYVGDVILVNYIYNALAVVVGSGSGSGVSAYAEFACIYSGSDTVVVAQPGVAKVPLNQSVFNEGIVLDTVDSTWTHNATGKYMITLMYRQDSTTWGPSDDLWHQYAVKKDGATVVGRSVRASSRNAGPAIVYQFIYDVDSTSAEYSINGWVSFGDTKVGLGPTKFAGQVSAFSDSNFLEPGILVNIRKL